VAVEPEPVAEEPSFTADAVSEPIDADEEAESLAAETAASEIAAAFDPWPLPDEDGRAEGTPSRDTTALSSPAASDEETTAEIAAPAPAEIDEAAEEVAAETAAAEIAAAFDAWPLHEDDEDTAGAPSAEAELAMAPDRAEPEPVHDVAEPTAYAGIPIETDEAGDAWGLAAAGFTPSPEPTAEPTVEESPATWPAEDREKAAEEATDQPGAEPGGEPSEGPAAEPPPWGRVPVEIAAEPPAADDAALLRASEPVAAFAEPPILPQEPAFWEPGARARAPFAMPQAEPWEPAPTEAAPIETSSPTADLPPSNSPPTSPPPTPSVKPSASGPNPSSPPAKPRPPVARRKRGPAARAIRRLRYLID
jgi:hypothetical protein